MESTPQFLQGIYGFEGKGYFEPFLLDIKLQYSVPGDKRTQLIYLRAGNATGDLITLILMRDGKPMRYFPIGALADSHVSLAVVEDLQPDTKLEVFIAAPSNASGVLVLDIGMLEI
jgi:assimilatory nitrate reductase catalytic subunit